MQQPSSVVNKNRELKLYCGVVWYEKACEGCYKLYFSFVQATELILLWKVLEYKSTILAFTTIINKQSGV